jgi:hypothetical protein
VAQDEGNGRPPLRLVDGQGTGPRNRTELAEIMLEALGEWLDHMDRTEPGFAQLLSWERLLSVWVERWKRER